METPHITLYAETLFHIGPIPVTNSMLTMFLVMIGLVLFFALATRRMQRGLKLVLGKRLHLA